MNTINNTLTTQNYSIKSTNQTSNIEKQTRIHHHHHTTSSQDSVKISDDSKNELINNRKSPLDSLVSDGTITQDQENSIKSAFTSARQAAKSGTYGSKPANPLSSLVANGTITQSQADSITSAFKSKIQSNENNIAGSEGNHIGHHHHHKGNTQDITESAQSVLENIENANSENNSLETSNSENIPV